MRFQNSSHDAGADRLLKVAMAGSLRRVTIGNVGTRAPPAVPEEFKTVCRSQSSTRQKLVSGPAYFVNDAAPVRRTSPPVDQVH